MRTSRYEPVMSKSLKQSPSPKKTNVDQAIVTHSILNDRNPSSVLGDVECKHPMADTLIDPFSMMVTCRDLKGWPTILK
jgi:hypothetical protein